MGGCHCSYRDCTSRSDGKTHMFHFPVFDKVRCHQWITNAQKLNFLNLKLSQLKNRVICQHHFKDEYFMNNTKGKLKFTAVPTEDGPFCKVKHEDAEKEFSPINLDDIENENLNFREKQANFSMKYGDFLTNNVSDLFMLSLPSNNKHTLKMQSNGSRDKDRTRFSGNNNEKDFYNTQNNVTPSSYDIDNIKAFEKINSEQIAVPKLPEIFSQKEYLKPAEYQNIILSNPTVVAIEFEDLNLNSEQSDKPSEEVDAKPQIQQLCQSNSVTYPSHNIKQSSQLPSSKKIRIVSEKRISEPVIVEGKLETVSPMLILTVPNKKKKQNVDTHNMEIKPSYADVTNAQNLENLQIITNNTSHPSVTEQVFLPEYMPTTTQIDQTHMLDCRGAKNLQVQNVELVTDGSQPIGQIDLEEKPFEKQFIQNQPSDMQYISAISTNVYNVSTPSQNVPLHNTMSTDVQKAFRQSNEIVPNVCTESADTQYVSGISQNAKGICEAVANKQNKKRLLKSSNSTLANKCLLKNKMPPEKLAAIEEKRKFNIKLRDIIDSCLNKLDEDTETDVSKLSAASKIKVNDKKVVTYLSSNPDSTSSQENSVACLEARLQKMEDTLLNKIDQNSQRILELRKSLKQSPGKRTAVTQTYMNDEATKKHLYQQISKYLSPDANSLIYEELFINKFSQNSLIKVTSPKKRKKR